MAPSFGRSISFPLSPARSSSKAAARHVRSISLPCRSHPLLAHLLTHISAVRAWAADPSTAAPSEGLARVGALHNALAELLLLPEPQDAVRAATAASDRLLDAFLLLADAHRGFQETLLALKADVADVQAAIRRRDAARLASAARSQRKNEKELARLAATVSSGAAKQCARLGLTAAGDTEMAAALMDAVAASAAASAAVFSAAASMSASTSSSSSKKTAAFAAFTNKKEKDTADQAAPEKLEDLSQCIHDCEAGSDMVFRSIVRTRVSLLNIRTPTI